MPDPTTPSREELSEVIRRCGQFAATVKIGDAPARVRLRLRAQLATVLAVTYEADSVEGCRSATQWARRSPGPHPLLGTSARVARLEAIVGSVERARSRPSEWALLGATGAPSCAVALCLGAVADVPWSELESAQLAAVELGARIGLATAARGAPINDAICGAVAAARIVRLDGARTGNAIAATIAGGTALDGVIAAELAFDGALPPAPRTLASFSRAAFVQLGTVWLAETIHLAEHGAAPIAAQTAVDAAREVLAQARTTRRGPLRFRDVRAIDVETTLFGGATDLPPIVAAALGDPSLVARVRVRHAWDLTSALLFRVAEAVDLRALIADVSIRDVAATLFRVAVEHGLDPPPLGQIVADVSRAVTLRSAGALRPTRLALPFGNRVTLTTTDGVRYAAERATGRGAPDASDDRVVAIARERFLAAASKPLGGFRALGVFESIMDPPSGQTVASFVDRLRR